EAQVFRRKNSRATTRSQRAFPLQMAQVQETLRFTRMCKYFRSNRCNLGTNCNFAHSQDEMRDQPDLVGTRLCFQFARKGQCKSGENCKFAHGKSELRRLPNQTKVQQEILDSRLVPAATERVNQAPPGLEAILPPPGLDNLLGHDFLPLKLETLKLETLVKQERSFTGSTESACSTLFTRSPTSSEPTSPMGVSIWL
ncbi:unnamed protein product, partial [Effrenium voratum]